MRMPAQIFAKRVISRFFRNSDGATTVVFGVSAIVMMATIGLAIDVARYYNMASKMQDAIDAAALTGAKLLGDDSQSDSDVKSVVLSNYTSAMTQAGVKYNQIAPLAITIDRDKSSVSAVSHVQVRSIFGPLINTPKMTDIVRDTNAVFQMNQIELAMVLDITGSMNDNNKLADMKVAATDVVDVLLDTAINEKSIRIAIAPYAASVNAGAYAATVSSTPPPTTTCTGFWFFGLGCKTTGGVDVDTCVIERQGAQASTDAAPVGVDQLPGVPSLPYGNYSCPQSTVVPLLGKSQAATLKSVINGYLASGSTAGHIGTAWGWYLLSPEWDDVFTGDSAPEPYGQASVTKSMIMMTDGLFNTSYLSGASTDIATQTEESYQQFRSLCDGAKGKGIVIYTVGFALSDARARSELESCASAPANFYDAQTGAQLKDAFKAIADKLNSLRVAS
ncbi:MAG: TadE/TadG family type IV pilus assembly protein [Hyphomicrobium sp.]